MSTSPFTIPPFSYDAVPGRVVFGPGSRRQLADEALALGAGRVLIVAGRDQDRLAADITSILGDLVVGRFDDVVQHVPVARATEATDLARSVGADTIVTLGGGSATGFGKAIVLQHEAQLIAVPTTYAGSEMTTIYGLTDDGHKRTGNDHRVKPGVVIYDPELTLSLPARIAGPSGLNALAHCVEALYGPGANPVISAISLEGIRALHQSLPAVCAQPDDLDARTGALYGAYLAGVALASGGTALHHKTCHVLGGMFDLGHGDMNAVVLGHAVAFTAPAIPEPIERMGVALGTDDVPRAIFDLAVAIDAPTSLREIGMPEDGIDRAAERVVQEAAANPRRPDLDGVRAMLRAAWAGDPPATVGGSATT